MSVTIKSEHEIELMREAGRIHCEKRQFTVSYCNASFALV